MSGGRRRCRDQMAIHRRQCRRIIMKGIFQCHETDALAAAAAFSKQYNGWQLKTISQVAARSRK